MLQIKRMQMFSLCFFMLVMALMGCSERNAQSPIDPDTGRHAKDWLPAAHMTAARSGPDECSTCHGADLEGGISGVSCTSCHLGSPTSVHPADWVPLYSTHGLYVKANSTAACANQHCHGLLLTGVANSGPSCTSCHLGSLTSGHPADWVPVYSTHGPYVDANGTSACANQYCHGAALTGVADSGPSCTLCHLGSPTSVHPADWVPVYSTHGPYVETNGTGACANLYCHGASLTGVANSGPSCTSCHMGGVTESHPAGWLGDACSNHGSYAYTNGTAGCANAACHGTYLGGVSQSGPSCTQCHTPIPNSNQCNYCHGIPPNGAIYPNIAGKHAEHMQLSNVTCATCHARPCDQHGNGIVEVIFDPIYNAKTGIASFNTSSSAKTCSEISCHGGPRTQTPDQAAMNPLQSDPAPTPDWYTGTIDVYDATNYGQCAVCHSYGTTEYNGFYSGKHSDHVFGSSPTPPYNVLNIPCYDCHDFSKLAVNHFTNLDSPVISAGTASATIKDWMLYDGTNCKGCHTIVIKWWE